MDKGNNWRAIHFATLRSSKDCRWKNETKPQNENAIYEQSLTPTPDLMDGTKKML